MTTLRIDEDFVRKWAARYLEAQSEHEAQREASLFGEIGGHVRARGHFTRDEFLEVGEWKSPRARPRLRRNRRSDVESVTALALGVADERSSILTALEGVGDAMASALLTVWRPDRYTIYDWRAVETLRLAGHLAGTRRAPPFGLYLETCRRLAADSGLGDDLRSLDRALWKFSQERSRARRRGAAGSPS